MQVSVDIHGIEQLKRKFSGLTDAKQRTALRNSLAKAAAPIRKAARDEAPVDKGTLRKSIAIFRGKSKKWINVQVGARKGKGQKYDGYYAHFVHDGHEVVNPHERLAKNIKKEEGGYKRFTSKGKNTKVNPFLKRAADRTKQQSIAIFQKELDIQIKKVMNR